MVVRWALCGTGAVCEDFCTCLNSLPDTQHQVIAVAARSDVTKAAEFASKFHIPHSVGSYQALIDVPDVDVIYIGTIQPYHVDTCLMYIQAGKNILCEKPMTLSLYDCQRVLAAARQKGVFFLEGIWTCFFPAYKHLREEILAKRVIGEVKMVQVGFCKQSLSHHRLQRWGVGGGAFADLGTYLIHAATTCFGGFPTSVKAEASFTQTGQDKACAVVLKFPGENLATLSLSFEVPDGASSLIIWGTEGIVTIPDLFWCPTKLYVNGELRSFPLTDTNCSGKKFNFPNSEGFVYEIQAVGECLENGLREHPLMTHQESERIMYIFDRILQQCGISYTAPTSSKL